MAEFTPGPWVYRQSNDTVCGTGYPIAKIKVPRTGDELRANARLIAAAPDLYEALVEMLGEPPETASREYYALRDKARAALAKAKGATR